MALTSRRMMWNSLAPFERGWWRALGWAYGRHVARAGTLELSTIDLRLPVARLEYDLAASTTQALERLSTARGGFGELVTSHLSVVAAMPVREPKVHINVSAYVCPFTGPERESPHYWASQLVWAATVIRLARDALLARGEWQQPAILNAAWEAQVRFLNQFEDAEHWRQVLAGRGWKPAA